MDPRFPAGLSLLVRTDFSDDGLWQEVLRSTVDEEVDEDEPYYPQFTVVDDPCFEGVTIEGIVAAARPDRSYAFIADARTMTNPEHPLLVVDTSTETAGHGPEQSVRVTQPAIETVESNLATGNVDFVDVVRSAEADGVYRGADLRGEQPAVQSIPLSAIREAVALRSDVPTFARLLHDIDSAGPGASVPVYVDVDLDYLRDSVRRPPPAESPAEGMDAFREAISTMASASAFELSVPGNVVWVVVSRPDTLEPLAAYKQVSAVDPQ